MTVPSTHLSLVIALQGEDSSGEAWTTFVERYRPVIVTWCLSRGVKPRHAEDIAQEILLKIFRSLSTYDPSKGKFRTWLRQVIATSIADYFRFEQRFVGQEGIGGDSNDAFARLQQPEAADELAANVDSYVDVALAGALDRVKSQVASSTWAVFEQTVVHGRAVADVAKELGLSVGAAHMAKRRASDKVREEYGKCRVNAQE